MDGQPSTPTYLAAPLCAVVALCALASCAPTQAAWDWRWDVAEADRLADEEQYDEALAEYRALAARAPDEFERRYLYYRMGYLEESREHWQDAIDCYLLLLDHHPIYDPIEDYTPRALFRVGLILYDELDEPLEGLKMWRHVIHYYPDAEGPAWRALDSIRSHFERTHDDADAVRFFADEYAALHESRIGDNLLYWLAHWYRYRLNDPDRALELFLALRERYWESSLRDQGDWEIVELLHERGEYERELEFLHALSAEREGSLILGPYVTENMENANLRAGTLRLEQLHDPWGAIDEWETFLDVWSVSLQRDDAARGIVAAAVVIGDPALIREKARWFLRDFDESRFVPYVEGVLAEYGGEVP